MADPINANDLRALAEAADGIRNDDAFLIENPNGSTPRYIVVNREELERLNAKPILELRTTDEDEDTTRKPKRKPLELITKPGLVFDDGTPVDLSKVDAIFTSISAMDKFAVPYYARMRSLDDCKLKRDKFAKDRSMVALFHLPSSVDKPGEFPEPLIAVRAVGGGGDKSQLTVTLTPF